MSIFKAYDIRGIYGEELTDDIFYKIARAYARFLGGPKKIAVARDCRTSSPRLFNAFSTGLVEEGVEVIDVGVASTPMSYFANGSLKVDGSVMITASHNPPSDNGLKVSRKGGLPVGYDSGLKEVEAIVNASEG
jgi:phosphomannomutase